MRQLIYAPIIHTAADLGSAAAEADRKGAALAGRRKWDRHKATIERFWEALARYFAGVEAEGLKIYQDGLVADGALGMKIVRDAVRKGSRNYQIIADLVARGAAIVRTEDIQIVKAEVDQIMRLTRATSPGRKMLAALGYKLRSGKLLSRRDEFIANTIADTLEEGETGALLMGAHHEVLRRLPGDIKDDTPRHGAEAEPLRDAN